MANYILNFSSEDFVPSSKCFFIKRISNVKDETFLYNLEMYLEKSGFNGVVYVGEEIGEVLEEHFSQELWEKSVLMKVGVIGFYLSGDDVTLQHPTFKDRLMFVQKCKTYRIETKFVNFNSKAFPVESEQNLKVLEGLVNILVKKANERAGEWCLLFYWLNWIKLYNRWIGKKENKERR